MFFFFISVQWGAMVLVLFPVILLGEEGEEEEDAGQLVDHVEQDKDGGGVDLRTLPHHHEGHHL